MGSKGLGPSDSLFVCISVREHPRWSLQHGAFHLAWLPACLPPSNQTLSFLLNSADSSSGAGGKKIRK